MPIVPIDELGISSSVMSEVYPDRGGGFWKTDPERAIAEVIVLPPSAKKEGRDIKTTE